MGEEPEELRQDIEQTRERMEATMGALGDKVSPRAIADRRKAAVRDRFQSVRTTVMGRADDVTSTGRGLATSSRDVAGSAKDTLTGAPDMAKRQAQGNPMAAGFIAFGAGLLVAALLPESESEQRLAHKIEPQLADTAEQLKDAGQQAASTVGEKAKEHTEELKQSATEATAQVKEQAQSSADTVKSEAKDRAETVKDQAKPS